MRDSDLPTHFGERYADDLKRVPHLNVYLHANVRVWGLTPGGANINELDVATLSGRHFKVKPKCTSCWRWARSKLQGLMLASNDVMPTGGRQRARFGRAVLCRSSHSARYRDAGAVRRKACAVLPEQSADPGRDHARRSVPQRTIPSLKRSDGTPRSPSRARPNWTILVRPSLAATATALGVEASNAVAFSLGGGWK